MDLNRIHQGHVLELLRSFPDASVQTVVTSPPYWGLRLYSTQPQTWGGSAGCAHDWKVRHVRDTRGLDGSTINNAQIGEASRFDLEWATCAACGAFRGELGLEPRNDCLAWARGEPPCAVCYNCHLRSIFGEVRRVLRDDGILFLNLGDSYTSGGRTYRDPGASKLHEPLREMPRPADPPGLKPKDLCMVPARAALALQYDGWYLRNDNVWSKKNCMPSSVQDRCTVSHEYVYMMSKSERYFFDGFAVRERAVSEASGNKKRFIARLGEKGRFNTHLGSSIPWENDGGGRNKRTVWSVAAEQFSEELCRLCGRVYGRGEFGSLPENGAGRICRCGASDGWVSHFAIFPEELASICVLAGTSEKGACSDCGAPWRRLLGKVSFKAKDYTGKWSKEDDQSSGRRIQSNARAAREAGGAHSNPFPDPVHVGWVPTCRCHGRIVDKEAGTGDGAREITEEYVSDLPLDRHPIRRCVVLDPFMGSGTTALVALKGGRDFVGCELNPDYVRLAEHRISEELAQKRLF